MEYDAEFETPKSMYPLLSTKNHSILGETYLFHVESIEAFKDKKGVEKPSLIITSDSDKETYKYVPNKTAQGKVKELGFKKFSELVGKSVEITVVETTYMNRKTLGLMIANVL